MQQYKRIMFIRALIKGILWLLYVSLVVSKRHVIRSSPKLRQQGYAADIDLGAVMAEAVVDSPEACVALCETSSVCQSVMLVGQLCRMFAPPTCPCFAEFTHISGTSRYLIGKSTRDDIFTSAMDKCLSLGAHAVHINSREEHEMIKEYIRKSGEQCRYVMTGAWSPVAGSSDLADWSWYYSNDFNAVSQPLMFSNWARRQPNNYGGEQQYIGLDRDNNYNFNDLDKVSKFGSTCFLCECP